mmetsp:Transcript_18471/g.29388  ORF Transcript_18471/g.29388 Transcript_18471/m.29388 type:complete len:200 (-) Transcript_18471:1258-1857(-)
MKLAMRPFLTHVKHNVADLDLKGDLFIQKVVGIIHEWIVLLVVLPGAFLVVAVAGDDRHLGAPFDFAGRRQYTGVRMVLDHVGQRPKPHVTLTHQLEVVVHKRVGDCILQTVGLTTLLTILPRGPLIGHDYQPLIEFLHRPEQLDAVSHVCTDHHVIFPCGPVFEDLGLEFHSLSQIDRNNVGLVHLLQRVTQFCADSR